MGAAAGIEALPLAHKASAASAAAHAASFALPSPSLLPPSSVFPAPLVWASLPNLFQVEVQPLSHCRPAGEGAREGGSLFCCVF